jgi:hypothetical protein
LDSKTYDRLIELFMNQPQAQRNMNGDQIMFRCPFCGDSIKSDKSKNFSVKIKSNDKEPMYYQCFRASCKVSGRVDEDFIRRLGSNDYTLLSGIANHNKSIKYDGNKFKFKRAKALALFKSPESNINDFKIKYLNGRLGTELTYKDLNKYKICLDINNLLKLNKVNVPDDKTKYYNKLSLYGIGFISTYNDYINIRDASVDLRLGRRYTNLNVFDSKDDNRKYYNIPTKINILSTEPTVINISEGPFDIISVFHNLNIDREYENQIFCAAGGASMKSILQHFIQEYGLIDIKLNIFADGDVKLSAYKEILSFITPFILNSDTTVYYNEYKDEKDFGVKKEKMKIISHKI